MAKINLEFLEEFKSDMNKFGNAINEANENCSTLLQNPGFSSSSLSAKMQEMKTKLDNMTQKWTEISQSAESHINRTREEIQARQSAIEKTLQ